MENSVRITAKGAVIIVVLLIVVTIYNTLVA
jgi:hypothetical protein